MGHSGTGKSGACLILAMGHTLTVLGRQNLALEMGVASTPGRPGSVIARSHLIFTDTYLAEGHAGSGKRHTCLILAMGHTIAAGGGLRRTAGEGITPTPTAPGSIVASAVLTLTLANLAEGYIKGLRPFAAITPDDLHFELKPASPAVDTGILLPTVTDGFTGKAPDLGAIELGQPAPHYGPRP